MVEWSTLTDVQMLVLWQSSQLLPLAIWVAGFPGAVLPLWQLAQVPETAV